MTTALEGGISAIFSQARDKLLPFIEAKPPAPLMAKAFLCLSRQKITNDRRPVLDFFTANPNEKDAIRAVAEVGGVEAIEALIKRARDSHAKNRPLLAEVLGNTQSVETMAALKDLLGDPDRYVRIQAAYALFNIGGQEAALALCKFISDPDEWISMTILKLLCKLKEYESIPYLIQHFTKDPDIRRKALMVSFLSMFRSVTLVNVFDEGMRSRDARLKANSIEAIGELELPDREIERRISPFLNDPNNRIRANALLILARSNPVQARPGIVSMVDSGDNQLRRSAAFILGQVPPEGNEELAKKLVADPVADVRKRMILSLRKFPLDFVQNLLDHPLKDQNKWIRKAAIDVAGFFPDFNKGPILRLLKSEAIYPNLVSCMEFFGKHPDEEAAKIIRSRIQDHRWQVVSAAVKSMATVQGLQGIEPLVSQIYNAKDIRIINEYLLTTFKMGSLDTFDSILEKATLIKRPWMNDRFLPALDLCLELLTQPSKLPAALAARLSGVEAPEPRAVQTTVSAAAIQPEPAPAPPPVVEVPAPGGEAESSDDESLAVEQKAKLPKDFIAGIKFYNLGKYQKARQCMEAALAEQPDLAKAHLYIGIMAAEEKEYAEAQNSLTIFLESEPDNQKAMMLLGKVYKSLRDWENMANIFERLANTDPPPSSKVLYRILKELGLAYIFLQRNEEATQIFGKICNEDPSDSEGAFYLATAFFNMENFSQAKGIIMELLRHLNEDDKMYKMAQSLNDKIDEAMVEGQDPPDEPPPEA